MSSYSNSPYREIPEELLDGFTMGGRIPVFDWWIDGSKREGVQWTNSYIESFCSRFTPINILNNMEGYTPYGHEPCINLFNSFVKYNLTDKNIAVVGSETPWIEAMLINLNNKVTTIEYNVPSCKYTMLECKDYFSFFETNTEPFDAVVTFSSIEHSGLGRYGDPLDPDGDIKTMKTIYTNLHPGGILIWGAPVGKDAFTWNAHRVYGETRLPLLFKEFDEIEWIGMSKESLFDRPLENNSYQPVVVLKRK
jgi:hypothetical protein